MSDVSKVPVYKDSQMPVERRVADLVSRMTLKEKIGQMVQCTGAEFGDEKAYEDALREGMVGSRIGCDSQWAGNEGSRGISVEELNLHQRIAVEESRLGIPVINGRDIIHGHRTVMPVPLAQAASFDPEEVRRSARLAASEASAEGIHWTFAPMMDICRNPKWGRVIEGFGEDPYLAEEMAVAMVKGFQGDDMSAPDSIVACAKHFAGYGYCEGGRDYDASEITSGTFHNVVLRPFKAAVMRGGVGTVMTSFQSNGGIPSSASGFLLRRMLRETWGFRGFVVSDWGAVGEIEFHGACQDAKDAVRAAVNAGVNMEMIRSLYPRYIEALINERRISEETIDELVSGILRIKFMCGLFEHPYTEADPSRIRSAETLAAARRQAAHCMVLAKNNGILPFSDSLNGKRVALIGPMVHERGPLGGSWNLGSPGHEFRTIGEAFAEEAEKRGVSAAITDSALWDEQLRFANRCDVVVLCVGEHSNSTGETHASARYRLPVGQDELVDAVRRTGRPFVVVCVSGRPFPIPGARDHADALLYAWHCGTETANALMDVLFGEQEPSGRLPITVPEHEGQIPIYYGRKMPGKVNDWENRNANLYDDGWPYYNGEDFLPMYPFGFGLGYTTFDVSGICVDKTEIPAGDAVTVRSRLINTGSRRGTAVVQCYLTDVRASVSRPMKELVGFRKVTLDPGCESIVEFELNEEAMGFYDADGNRLLESGEFRVGIGLDSTVRPSVPFFVR